MVELCSGLVRTLLYRWGAQLRQRGKAVRRSYWTLAVVLVVIAVVVPLAIVDTNEDRIGLMTVTAALGLIVVTARLRGSVEDGASRLAVTPALGTSDNPEVPKETSSPTGPQAPPLEALTAEWIPPRSNGRFIVTEGALGGRLAPALELHMPLGRLPQKVLLPKERCKELLHKIEQAQRDDGGPVVLEYSNCRLVFAIPEDANHGAGFSRYPAGRSAPILEEALGLAEPFADLCDAVDRVANDHRPSYREFQAGGPTASATVAVDKPCPECGHFNFKREPQMGNRKRFVCKNCGTVYPNKRRCGCVGHYCEHTPGAHQTDEP